MSTGVDDSPARAGLMVVFGVVAAVVLLVLVSVLVVDTTQRRHGESSASVLGTVTALVTAAGAAAPVDDRSAAALAASDAASVQIENGVVQFYFAPGSIDLAEGAALALVDVVKQAQEGASVGRKLVVSGFHDATGDAAKNVQLARQRARTVQHALIAAGVTAAQIELRKPAQLPGPGSDAQARRVEVQVQ